MMMFLVCHFHHPHNDVIYEEWQEIHAESCWKAVEDVSLPSSSLSLSLSSSWSSSCFGLGKTNFSQWVCIRCIPCCKLPWPYLIKHYLSWYSPFEVGKRQLRDERGHDWQVLIKKKRKKSKVNFEKNCKKFHDITILTSNYMISKKFTTMFSGNSVQYINQQLQWHHWWVLLWVYCCIFLCTYFILTIFEINFITVLGIYEFLCGVIM